MAYPHRIVMLVYNGFELLDLSGPTSVFNAANSVAETMHYDVAVVSDTGGPVTAACGITVSTTSIDAIGFETFETTVLVVGAEGAHLRTAMRLEGLQQFLVRAAGGASRCGSVCSGAFVLAAAGLLDGKRATTHWAGYQHLQKWFPRVSVDREALYVADGSLWTSAGVTTGIDMALALVEADHGANLKGRIARHLVVYAHRPGFQSQFSTVLNAQIAGTDLFSKALAWMEQNLHKAIRVEDLAEVSGMTDRSFYRKFKAKMGIPPARFLCLARLERARQLLAAKQPVKVVYPQVGFASEAAFRTAFKANFGTTPTVYAATQSEPEARADL